MSDFRDPFEAASWPLETRRTVLVNFDLQNDVLHPDGWYAKSDIDIAHVRRAIGPTRELVAACRAHGVPVVWTRQGMHGVEDGSIGATCKGALFRDFKPIVVEECTGKTLPHLHDPAIEMIRVGWGQVNTLERTLAELTALPAVLAQA